jgi:xanthine dehydrogenase small subunit
MAMFDAPAALLQSEPVLAALTLLAQDPPLQTTGGFYAPQTLAELAELRVSHPQAQLLAGSTDVGLWVNKQLREFAEVIYIGRVAELQRIEVIDGHLHIGAGASLEAAWRALALHWPALQEVWQRFASLPIRQVGTMGGNVANGSPIGDSAPALMALDAVIVLQRGLLTREMPLQDFYTGYMKNQLQTGEFVQALRVPLPTAAAVRVYKISKRFDCDISALCAGFSVTLQDKVVVDVRLAFGGLAATVARATQAEAAVRGQPWTEATVRAGVAALAQDFSPLSDLRASSAYRAQVAQNLLRRFWLETRPDAALRSPDVSVFSRDSTRASA